MNQIMNRKGVTPVIAVVLLMTISIAATGAAYTFIINAQQDVRQGFEDKWGQKELEQKSDLNIEHIYESGGYALLTVRNTGTVPQRIWQDEGGNTIYYWNLYVGGPPATDWEFVGSSTKTLAPSATITINSTELFPSSGQKEFRLVGRYGSSDTYVCYSTGSSSC